MSETGYLSPKNLVPLLHANPKLFLEQNGGLLISWLNQLSVMDEVQLTVGQVKDPSFRLIKTADHAPHTALEILQREIANFLHYLPEQIGGNPTQIRPSQEKFIANFSEFLSQYSDRSKILELIINKVTGTGKTLLFLMLSQMLVTQPNQKLVIVVTHVSLLDQTLIKISEYYPHESVSYVSSSKIDKNKDYNFPKDVSGRIVVVVDDSLGKLKTELDKLENIEVVGVILDEAHLLRSQNFQTKLSQITNPNTLVVKVSATPNKTRILPIGNLKYERILVGNTIHYQDPRSKLSGHVVHSETMQEVMETNEICPIQWRPVLTEFEFKVTPDQLNKEGDFAEVPTINFFKAHWDEICGAVFEAYKRDIANGVNIKKVFAVCPSIELSHRAGEKFCRETGKISASISSNESFLFTLDKQGQVVKKKVDAALLVDAYKIGEIDAIFQIKKLREGFDDPEIDCIMMLWFTTLVDAYIQSLGRGTRFLPGKILKLYEIILGNYHAVNPLIVNQAMGVMVPILDTAQTSLKRETTNASQDKPFSLRIDQDVRFIQAISSNYASYSDFYNLLRGVPELRSLKNSLGVALINQAIEKFTSNNLKDTHPLTWSASVNGKVLYNPSLALHPEFIKILQDSYRENKTPRVIITSPAPTLPSPELVTLIEEVQLVAPEDEKQKIIADLKIRYQEIIGNVTHRFNTRVVARMLGANFEKLETAQLIEFLSSESAFTKWLGSIFNSLQTQSSGIESTPAKAIDSAETSYLIRQLDSIFHNQEVLSAWNTACQIQELEMVNNWSEVLSSSDHRALLFYFLEQSVSSIIDASRKKHRTRIDSGVKIIEAAYTMIRVRSLRGSLSDLSKYLKTDLNQQKVLLDRKYQIFKGTELERFNTKLISSNTDLFNQMIQEINCKQSLGLKIDTAQQLLTHFWTLRYGSEPATAFILFSSDEKILDRLQYLFNKTILKAIKSQIEKSFSYKKSLDDELIDLAEERLHQSPSEDLILAYRPIYTHLIETLRKNPQISGTKGWYSRLRLNVFTTNATLTISDFTNTDEFVNYYKQRIDISVRHLVKKPWTEEKIDSTLASPQLQSQLKFLADALGMSDELFLQSQLGLSSSALQSATITRQSIYGNLSDYEYERVLVQNTYYFALKKVLVTGLENYWTQFQIENSQQKVEISFNNVAESLLTEIPDLNKLQEYLSTKDSQEFRRRLVRYSKPAERIVLVTNIFKQELDDLIRVISNKLVLILQNKLRVLGISDFGYLEGMEFIAREPLAKWAASILASPKYTDLTVTLTKVIDKELSAFPSLDFHCFVSCAGARSSHRLSFTDVEVILNVCKPAGFSGTLKKQPELLKITWQDSATNLGKVFSAIDEHFHLDQQTGKRYISEVFFNAKTKLINIPTQSNSSTAQTPTTINGKKFYEYV